jgi:hypothetical protein
MLYIYIKTIFEKKFNIMRLVVLHLLLLITSVQCFSQNLAIKSFRLLENDLDARQNYPVRDQNGNLCAIIKVMTTETGFDFDNGTLGITKVEPKTAEIWLYVPFGTRKLSIAHPKLGMVRDYIINIPIQQGRCYELKLVTGKVITTIEEEQTSQYFTITSEPSNAIVFIDDEQQTKLTPFSKKLSTGKHTYRVELADYHNSAGAVELKPDKKEEINITLKPAFGYAFIKTTPEDGATILIDNKPISGTTPFKSQQLVSGKHIVKVVKPFYKPASKDVYVIDEQTTELIFELQPNFATVSISSNSEAEILIDGSLKASGNWKGRVEPGPHTFEASQKNYSIDRKTLDLEANQIIDFTLTPQPKTGNLDINSEPLGALISIDGKRTINGKDCGTTPITINKLLIGTYKLTLSIPKHGMINKTIAITEGKTTELKELIPKGKLVSINSNPTDIKLKIDGTDVGNTPYSGILIYGSHKLLFTNKNGEVEKSITVSQDEPDSYSLDVTTLIKKDNSLSNNNIYNNRNNRTVGGPSNAFLSMLMPGLGDYYVIDNKEKAKIQSRIIACSFIVAAYFTYSSKIESDKYYKLYHNATTQVEMDKNYDEANRYYRSFLLSGGIASIIWIGDVIYVAIKGFNNAKEQQFGLHDSKNTNISFALNSKGYQIGLIKRF